MPGKKKKGAAGKKNGKGAKAVAEKDQTVKMCKEFLKAYQIRCTATGSTVSQRVCRECRTCLEDEKPLAKFVLEPSLPPARSKAPVKSARAKGRRTPSAPAATTKSKPLQDAVIPSTSSSAAADAKPAAPPLLLHPLTSAWMEVGYTHMRCLHVWGIELADDATVALSLFLESRLGPNLRVLELRDTRLSPWAIARLGKSLKKSQLTVLNMDYVNIPQASLEKLCECLQSNLTLQTLSLNYCHISSSGGETLGTLAAMSQIRVLSLIGNSIQCCGCVDLVRPIVALCESNTTDAVASPVVHDRPPSRKFGRDTDGLAASISAIQPASSSSKNDPASIEKESDAAEIGEQPETLPHLPPPLAKLYLQDNSLDIHSSNCPLSGGCFQSVVCMRAIKRWILSSPVIEEINLNDNVIGDGGGREILQALEERKEAGLPAIKVSVSARINPEIFSKIIEFTSTGKKKKGGKKKGKKKKK